jgi:hypothetical protein
MDSFTKEIKAIMERGNVASLPGDKLKTLIVKKVQDYSAEIELLKEEIPDLFLNLTDLILSGRLSRMHPDVLKVYMALGILWSNSTGVSKAFGAELSELTGIKDEPILKRALDDLKALGYIDSPEKPVLKRVKSAKDNLLHDEAE